MNQIETISITAEELESIKERSKKLARDKSYLQLIIHMTSRLGAIATLENVVRAIPQITLDNIGGTNIKLYYFIDNEIFYSDALGSAAKIEQIDDKSVQECKNSKNSLFIEHGFEDTMMNTPEFASAWDWTYPLLVGTDVIGILKMENLHIGADSWKEYLPTFFGYAALLLKNEILGYTKLQKAYNELELEVKARREAEEELELINDKLMTINAELEEEVAVRTEMEEELSCSNEQLIQAKNRLEEMVEDRTKEVNETMLELKRTSDEWVQAMDAFGDIIYLIDNNRRLIRANKKFFSQLGLDQKNSIGKVVSGLVHPHTEPSECPICQAQMALEDKIFTLEADSSHNPTPFPLEITTKIIRDAFNTPVAILTSLHDLTHTRKMEQELRTLNESLELRIQEELAKNREKDLLLIKQSRLAVLGDMLSNIAHHWRQPLNALAITVQDAKFAYEDGEINKEYMDKMVEDSMRLIGHMSTTIDDFRSFFRPDRANERFDIVISAKHACDLIYDGLKNSAVELEVRLPSTPAYSFGFQHEFSQVVLNLLNNAKDALLLSHTSEPKVTVDVSVFESFARIVVEDNGVGIEPDVMDKLFNPYFTTKEQGKGVGLGLYMSKMIIEQHMNGKIYARERTNGASFVIEMPLDMGEK